MRYNEPDAKFTAWCEGRTGFPFVDAAMRQLVLEGWMHNRTRMVVASFLVKDLHLEWQHGANFFADHLVDFDIASNSHGWQWTAGTGTDASPYYRIFNPIEQGKKFDADGDYIRKYVSELAVTGPTPRCAITMLPFMSRFLNPNVFGASMLLVKSTLCDALMLIAVVSFV
jgi:deoxyribodipyrimidine photo-lyase